MRLLTRFYGMTLQGVSVPVTHIPITLNQHTALIERIERDGISTDDSYGIQTYHCIGHHIYLPYITRQPMKPEENFIFVSSLTFALLY